MVSNASTLLLASSPTESATDLPVNEVDFGALPSEIISARMYCGPGVGPMLVAAGVWDGLADELYSTAASFGAVISGLDDSWHGRAAASMADSVAPYLKWLAATAEQAVTQVRASVTAYDTALAIMVSPSGFSRADAPASAVIMRGVLMGSAL
ncbi:PPE family protein [Mycobacterium nebraskense]|jgi:hypothetical protein|uniref:PPE family protein n=1 Tax=Mycobacterium nebraskense TaxID=244292 RepID=UPI00142D4798|nr:PPE family protein [Mycobacterium nebraskense]MCV7116284.1 PPE family protein [Mycobacterium nebraskense]